MAILWKWSKCLSFSKAILVLAFLVCPRTDAVLGDQIGVNPFWDWKTLHTEHFRINYPSHVKDTAVRAAQYFEEAHKLLTPLMKWTPPHRTEVVLVDNVDAANGLATAALRIGVVVWLTPPDNYFNITFYEDWLRLVILHEYTHFLNIDVIQDFWKVLKYIFGDIIRPNTLLQNWLLEGFAVYVETRFSRGGRGRSTIYDAIMRALVESNTLGTSDSITLDRISNDPPYYPALFVRYFYGYQMIHQMLKSSEIEPGDLSKDKKETFNSAEEILGSLMYRSGGRLPYFINGNLKNVIGKDWYQVWDEFLVEARSRIEEQLRRIRSRQVSKVKLLSANIFSIPGMGISPDGKYLAYTRETPDRRAGLVLRELETGDESRLEDKILGSGHSFSKDGHLVFSRLRRSGHFHLWSDLRGYNVEEGNYYWLTRDLRAKDPDFSPDGRQITFTLTRNQTVGLAIANVVRDGDRLRLQQIRKLYFPKKFGRVANPIFDRNGTKIIFSLHDRGKFSEELLTYDLETRKTRVLVSNGKFNRFPVLGPKGNVFYLSNVSGVDNLYLYRPGRPPRLITNVTTALSTPAFAPNGALYGSYLTEGGFQLAQVGAIKDNTTAALITIDPPPAPERHPKVQDRLEPLKNASHEDYSIFPSIWPRQWAPFLVFQPKGFYLGGQVSGFDALDRHRYLLVAAYDTLVPNPDFLGTYTNRSFGPDINLSGSYLTTFSPIVGSSVPFYTKKLVARSDISFAFRQTYSAVRPLLGVQIERSFDHIKSTDERKGTGRFVPSADLLVSYSNAQGSQWAISQERGRNLTLGVRAYRDNPKNVYKGLITATQYFNPIGHIVLAPRGSFTMTSRSSDFADSNVVVRGQSPRIVDTTGRVTAQGFDHLSIRGYPNRRFFLRAAAYGSAELRFPIFRIFRGWGTNPFFLKNLYAFGFGDVVYFPEINKEIIAAPTLTSITSAGGGLRLSSEIVLNIPLILSVEYHRGFKPAFGGDTQVYFSALVQPFEF